MKEIFNSIWSNITWFFRRIKRVIDYLPIIWNGYDFDYRHALDLFHFQLTRLANFMDSDKAYSVRAKQDARRLRTILELMTKVYDEEYRLEHHDKVEAIYGKSDIDWRNNNDGTYSYISMIWELADTPEKHKEAEELYSKLAKEGEDKHQRAKELLWKLVSHNLDHMWD
jgi:hypothetical protein